MLHLLNKSIDCLPAPAEKDRILQSEQLEVVGFVLSSHTYNIYNAVTIDIEQNGFWKRLPGCIWQP